MIKDLQETEAEDATQGGLLSTRNLEVPDEHNRQCAEEEVLQCANNDNSDNLSGLVMAFQFVCHPPLDVEIMPVSLDG